MRSVSDLSLTSEGKMAMSTEKKNKLRKYFKIFGAVLKFALLLVILIGLPLYIYFAHHEWIQMFSNMENVEALFKEYKAQSVFIYIGSQILQIVICIIPGQWLQFAAGYMYGFWLGYLYSLIGAFLGSVLTYYIAKILGGALTPMRSDSSEKKKIKSMLETLNSKKAVVLVFLIFLIPGVPKDLCNYIAAFRNEAQTVSDRLTIGRSPGMMGSLLRRKTITADMSALPLSQLLQLFCSYWV